MSVLSCYRFIFPVSWMEQNHGAINICIAMFVVAGRVCWFCRMSWTFPKVSSLTGWFGPCPWIASSWLSLTIRVDREEGKNDLTGDWRARKLMENFIWSPFIFLYDLWPVMDPLAGSLNVCFKGQTKWARCCFPCSFTDLKIFRNLVKLVPHISFPFCPLTF